MKTWKSTLILLQLLFSLFSCGKHASAELPILPDPLSDGGIDLPLVNVTMTSTMGVKTVLATLDTGTSGIMVSSKLFGVKDHDVIGVITCFDNKVCTNELGAEALETYFSKVDGIQAILGIPVLTTQPVEIDHLKSVRIGALQDDCHASAIPFTLDMTGRPTLDTIQVTGVSLDTVLIDTGSVYDILSKADSQKLPADVLANAMPETFCDIYGCMPGAFLTTSPSVCVGDTCATDVQVKYPAFNSIGMSFLSRYRARFDFSKNILQLCE